MWADRDLPVLAAIVRLAEDHHAGSIGPEAIAEATGLDVPTVRTAVRELAEHDPPLFTTSKFLSGEITVADATGHARRMVRSVNRLALIRPKFLNWLGGHTDRYMEPTEFLLPEPPSVAGAAVTEAEVATVVSNAVSRQLIEGPTRWGAELPWRVRLTREGLICVQEHAGDVDAWENRGSRAFTLDFSTTVTGDHNAVTAHSPHGSATSTHIDTGEAANAVRQLLEALPILPGTEEQSADLRETAEELLAEVEGENPQPGRLTALGRKVLDGLAAVPGSTLAPLLVEAVKRAFHLTS